MEKRTAHELFRGAHDDLLTTNKKEGPLLHCDRTSYHCGKRENGETAERTIRLDSAGEVPAAVYRESESHQDDNGDPPKKKTEAKHRSTSIVGLDLNSGLGLKGGNKSKRPFVGEFL